jgi:hypothetical protein
VSQQLHQFGPSKTKIEVCCSTKSYLAGKRNKIFMLIFCSSKSSSIYVVKNWWPVPPPKYHHPPLYQVLDCLSPDAGLCYLGHPKGCLHHTHWNFHSPLRPVKRWPSWTVAIILPNTQFIYTCTTHELISTTISNRVCSFHKFLMTKSWCWFSNISSLKQIQLRSQDHMPFSTVILIWEIGLIGIRWASNMVFWCLMLCPGLYDLT